MALLPHAHEAARRTSWRPVAGGGGFVVVVQVLTREAAEGVNLLYVSLQHLRSVDEQIFPLTLKQESANLE